MLCNKEGVNSLLFCNKEGVILERNGFYPADCAAIKDADLKILSTNTKSQTATMEGIFQLDILCRL